MSGGGKIFLFILLLPFLAVLGHDVYYSYFSNDDKIRQVERLNIDPNAFEMSDLGWIWNNYSPDTMEIARDGVEPDIWKEKVDPILQYPAMIVVIIPFAMGLIFCLFARILGVWPFADKMSSFSRKGKESDAVYKHAKSKALKYSRK